MEYNHYRLSSFKDVVSSFKYAPRIFKLLLTINKKYLIIISILYIISGIIPTLSILATQYLINCIQTGINHNIEYMLFPFIIYITISFLNFIIIQLLTYFEGKFQIQLSYKLNCIVLDKTKTLNLCDFENSEVYNKLKRAQNETANRPYVVFSSILNLIKQLITLISSASVLILWKWWIVIIILVVPIISTIYMIKLGNLQYKIQWNRAEKQRKSWYASYLLTNDIAFKEIRLYNLTKYFIDMFKELNEGFNKQDIFILIKKTQISVVFQMLDEIVGDLIGLYIIKSAFSGQILLGSTIAYFRCISNVQSNTQSLLETIASLYQNNLFIKQFFEFLDYRPNSPRIINYQVIDEIRSIEFKNVCFEYPNKSSYALKNINFKIYKGERVALVGENGSGKTTLVKLISRLYDNYGGQILVNDIPIEEIDSKCFREKIGVVFQDYTKYQLTFRENIGLGKLEYLYNDKKIMDTVERVNIKKMLNSLPKGIDSQLGVWFSNGVQLSGGQWQKIALSRAFLRDADCYILDEPSASLDPLAEYEIFKKSFELTDDKIGIFITHRLFNIRKLATRILVLDDGRLIEEGTHEELMNCDSHYKILYEIQNSTNLKAK